MAAGITNPDMSCYVLQNGTLQPIAQAISVTSVNERASKVPSTTRAQTPVAKTSQASETEIIPNHLDTSKNMKRTHNR